MIQKGEIPPPISAGGNQVETILLPADGVKMVTGTTLYGADISIEGMLFGKMLWAEHPHARILNIDTSKAEALPGVEKVITSRDIPGINQAGLLVRDQPAQQRER